MACLLPICFCELDYTLSSKPPDKYVTAVAVHIHYKGFGALMRQSGAKTPARWG